MKKFLFPLIILVTCFTTAQSTVLLGNLDISLEKETLVGDYSLTNLNVESSKVQIILHHKIAIKETLLNGQKISIKKTKEECYDCDIYEISLSKPITPSDTLHLKTKGSFKSYSNGKNKKDYKGEIVNNYGILRASEQSKWYPTFVGPNQMSSISNKTYYTYAIKASCTDCRNIYIGSGIPKSSGSTFESSIPTENIMLIAGDFDWQETDHAIYINIDQESTISYFDALFQSINSYYETTTAIKMPKKFTFAHLPSDNSSWGGFMTYPTIVNVNQKLAAKNLEGYLSHEVAHYLFGNVFKPKTNLYWLFLESFAEYYSYKYRLEYHPELMKRPYERLQKAQNFVRLDKVEHYHEITNGYRYLIGAFQLLAIEHLIGEEKMIAFTKALFLDRKDKQTNGYELLLKTLKNSGVDDKAINDIEEKIIKNFDLDTYTFVASKIKTTE
ncbi:hypothetical protein FEE95_18430 [Maribacter algarum]|uniref:Peptidase M1 membrane alanine aminopeptidase domain-containing protein n=1 Tax=Maribacter algarum (ex Zhang et al. 2020) TaxID=2578118 RepID=A0A5S3PHW7_9FLAO|nr:hypothetical protein [Maribacter algarum]TMM53874.1 hypothetical protein FEE95_18430 [Maribacter algarum]